MKIFDTVVKFFRKYFFNPKWKCVSCGREIFDGEEYLCDECKNGLPLNDGAICDHCGRKLQTFSPYCLTCKGVLTEIDKGRSVFLYEKPITTLIRKAKYYNGKYVFDFFIEYLAVSYFKNYFNADLICCVPMTAKRQRKRGYNQAEILAKGLAEKTSVKYFDGVIKKFETKRQAKLGRKERIKNLVGSFAVNDKTQVKDKKVLIVDDVSTTGATGEAVACALKKAGASQVFLLTVASVELKEKY